MITKDSPLVGCVALIAVAGITSTLPLYLVITAASALADPLMGPEWRSEISELPLFAAGMVWGMVTAFLIVVHVENREKGSRVGVSHSGEENLRDDDGDEDEDEATVLPANPRQEGTNASGNAPCTAVETVFAGRPREAGGFVGGSPIEPRPGTLGFALRYGTGDEAGLVYASNVLREHIAEIHERIDEVVGSDADFRTKRDEVWRLRAARHALEAVLADLPMSEAALARCDRLNGRP